MAICDLQAIDVHAHLGPCLASTFKIVDDFRSGDAEVILHRANAANTRLTIVSALRAIMPSSDNDPITANKQLASDIEKTDQLRQWIVVDPLRPQTFSQAAVMLKSSKSVGIKIHPEQHNYTVSEHGLPAFEFAAQHNAIIISHSGGKSSMPEDLVNFANDFPQVTLILAHLGFSWDGDPTHQVTAIKNAKNNNVFVDTSSAFSITPNLIEWAVSQIGPERILYGTDSPLYFAPIQRSRIDHADITDKCKKLILCGNAVKLFNFPKEQFYGKINY